MWREIEPEFSKKNKSYEQLRGIKNFRIPFIIMAQLL